MVLLVVGRFPAVFLSGLNDLLSCIDPLDLVSNLVGVLSCRHLHLPTGIVVKTDPAPRCYFPHGFLRRRMVGQVQSNPYCSDLPARNIATLPFFAPYIGLFLVPNIFGNVCGFYTSMCFLWCRYDLLSFRPSPKKPWRDLQVLRVVS